MRSGWYRWDGADLILRIHLQPRASHDAFAEANAGFIRVRVTAPPIGGRANTHLRAWLARCFKVSRSAVILEHGATARLKRVRIRAPAHLPLDALQRD